MQITRRAFIQSSGLAVAGAAAPALFADTLDTPKALTADEASRSDTSLRLTWSAVAGAASYEIEVVAGAFRRSATAVTNSIVVSGLRPNTTYTLRAKAVGTGATASSEFSPELHVPTRPPQPPPPSAEGGQMNATVSAATITWNLSDLIVGVSNADKLRVVVGTFSNGVQQAISSTDLASALPTVGSLTAAFDPSVGICIRIIAPGNEAPYAVNESAWSAATAIAAPRFAGLRYEGVLDTRAQRTRVLRRRYA